MIKQPLLCILLLLCCLPARAGLIINEVNLGSRDYFELFNYGIADLNLAGYTATVADSWGFGFDIQFGDTDMAANSGIVLVAESPLSGEINAKRNITWHYSRNLSLTLRNDAGQVVDFWGHGAALYGAPTGVTFAPLQLLDSNTNQLTYQRYAVTSQGLQFHAGDWILAPSSRGLLNDSQVYAPVGFPPQAVSAPTSALLMLVLVALLVVFRRFRPQPVPRPQPA